MTSLQPDISVTRQAIGRLVGSLSDDPIERAHIATAAAFEFAAIEIGEGAAREAFLNRARVVACAPGGR